MVPPGALLQETWPDSREDRLARFQQITDAINGALAALVFLASRDIERPTFWIEKAGPTPIFSSFHHLAER
jgi:hypothetical protein